MPPPHAPRQTPADEEFDTFIAQQNPVDVAAAEWLVRREEGLNATQRQELDQWLQADPRHASALDALEAVWGSVGRLPAEDVGTLRANLDPLSPAHTPASTPRPSRAAQAAQWVLLIPRLAMLLFAVSMAAALWLGWQTWNQRPVFMQDYIAARSEHRHLELPDGSRLWLDADTEARVRIYRNRREVLLQKGQAFFDVQANAHRPFSVDAGALRVTVLGTRFAVSHPEGDGDARVAVESGRVGNAPILTGPQK